VLLNPYADYEFIIKDFNVSGNLTMNVSEYFFDSDLNDVLSYSCISKKVACYDNLNGSIVVVPMKEGEGELVIVAKDISNGVAYSNEINILVDTKAPKGRNVHPKGRIFNDKPRLSGYTNEPAECRGSLNVNNSYGEMQFDFNREGLYYWHDVGDSLDVGEYTVYVKCKDWVGNMLDDGWNFEYVHKNAPTFSENKL
tara:strand:- start:488 stop:1078 length:591 start_codon:yes stop_codon:yes gene_type:complete